MLRTKYPQYFATIPDQSTGMPVLTPRWRVNVERGKRGARRVVQRRAARFGIEMAPRQRAYHDDERVWAHASTRGRIEAVVLRKGSLCCDEFGRARVQQVLTDWFDRADGAAQVIGALYVFELYHSGLAAKLRAARHAAESASRFLVSR